MPCVGQADSGALSWTLPVLKGAETEAPSSLQENPFDALVQHCPITPIPGSCSDSSSPPTFGCREHGGGQLALLRLQVPQGEPAWVPAGDHRDQVMGVSHIAGRGCGLQHRQPEGQTGEGNIRPQLSTSIAPFSPWRC